MQNAYNPKSNHGQLIGYGFPLLFKLFTMFVKGTFWSDYA